jgi:hypothetical protein
MKKYPEQNLMKMENKINWPDRKLAIVKSLHENGSFSNIASCLYFCPVVQIFDG